MAKRMRIRVILREYLLRLQVAEFDKPLDERRPIPTLTDIAREAGVTRAAMSYLANGKGKLVNLDNISRSIEFLRIKGFDTELADLLVVEHQPPVGGWKEGEDDEEQIRENRRAVSIAT